MDKTTIICRCEEISYEEIEAVISNGAQRFDDIKRLTRCGMGPCQGRICGPACEFLFNWRDQSIRPPIFPAKLSDLA